MENEIFDEANPEGLVIGNIEDVETQEFVRFPGNPSEHKSLMDSIFEDLDLASIEE